MKLSSAIVGLFILCSVMTARAEVDANRFKGEVTKARSALQEGDLKRAAVHFHRATELRPAPRVLVLLASIYADIAKQEHASLDDVDQRAKNTLYCDETQQVLTEFFQACTACLEQRRPDCNVCDLVGPQGDKASVAARGTELVRALKDKAKAATEEALHTAGAEGARFKRKSEGLTDTAVALGRCLSIIKITSEPSGQLVLVNGVEMGLTPYEWSSFGQVAVIDVEDAQGGRQKRTTQVESGNYAVEHFGPADARPPQSLSRRASTVLPMGILALGTVGLLTGAFMMNGAASDESVLKGDAQNGGVDLVNFRRRNSEVKSDHTTGLVVAVVGSVLAAGGVGWWYWLSTESESEKNGKVSVSIYPSHDQVIVKGSW